MTPPGLEIFALPQVNLLLQLQVELILVEVELTPVVELAQAELAPVVELTPVVELAQVELTQVELAQVDVMGMDQVTVVNVVIKATMAKEKAKKI